MVVGRVASGAAAAAMAVILVSSTAVAGAFVSSDAATTTILLTDEQVRRAADATLELWAGGANGAGASASSQLSAEQLAALRALEYAVDDDARALTAVDVEAGTITLHTTAGGHLWHTDADEAHFHAADAGGAQLAVDGSLAAGKHDLVDALLRAQAQFLGIEHDGGTEAHPGVRVLLGGSGEALRAQLQSQQTAVAAPAAGANIKRQLTDDPISVQSPYVAVNYIIALVGIFPSRDRRLDAEGEAAAGAFADELEHQGARRLEYDGASAPYIGLVEEFAGNFAPAGWALCHGQLLPIAQNAALFSILGTTYGGDGRTTFALPDLRGRIPIGEGQGPELTNRPLGSKGGAVQATLTLDQLPPDGLPVNVMDPYLVLTCLVWLEGTFPSTPGPAGGIGRMTWFAGNFAIRDTASCDGQLLSIPQATSLFALIGTVYGGDGQTTFALPDVRGRAIVGTGLGAGLEARAAGEKWGAESVVLTPANVPPASAAVGVSMPSIAIPYFISTSSVFPSQSRRLAIENYIASLVMHAAPSLSFQLRAEGQELQISQATSLFALIGTLYGGDGQTTFALPDTRGRAVMQQGTGPGLPAVNLAQKGGAEVVLLDADNLPVCPDSDGDGEADAACGGTDCNDNDSDVFQGATEVCDTKDNDCDGLADEGLTFDHDLDGYTSVDSCAGTRNDCDDTNADSNPGLVEVCDDVDNDCNGEVDEGLSFDRDGDGHTDVTSCHGTNDDCDDTDASVFPGAAELCDGLDNDCDGTIDDGLSFDNDGDSRTSVGSCEGTADDCDDDNPSVSPLNTEVCADGLDNDCDGVIDNDCDVDPPSTDEEVCTAYCAALDDNCHGLHHPYPTDGQCYWQCLDALKVGRVRRAEDAAGGSNTFQCRTAEAVAASGLLDPIDKGERCANAAVIHELHQGPCAPSVCDEMCGTLMNYCSLPMMRYGTVHHCRQVCESLAAGSLGDTTGNTAHCRLTYARRAQVYNQPGADGNHPCAATSEDGGGLCVDDGNQCVPDCAGKTCGSDGCVGTCGACGSGEVCNASGSCIDEGQCTPDCTGKQCGGDGCGGSCGSCGAGDTCNASGLCVDDNQCTPSCAGKACGSDGCGGSCGSCGAGSQCQHDFTCSVNQPGCDSCYPTTSGPCIYPHNNVCTGYVNAATQSCPYLSVACNTGPQSVASTSSGSVSAASVLDGDASASAAAAEAAAQCPSEQCSAGTSGSCQDSTGACYELSASGTCGSSTVACSMLDTNAAVSASTSGADLAVVVVAVRLSGVSRIDLVTDHAVRGAIVDTVASLAGTTSAGVHIVAAVDVAPDATSERAGTPACVVQISVSTATSSAAQQASTALAAAIPSALPFALTEASATASGAAVTASLVVPPLVADAGASANALAALHAAGQASTTTTATSASASATGSSVDSIGESNGGWDTQMSTIAVAAGSGALVAGIVAAGVVMALRPSRSAKAGAASAKRRARRTAPHAHTAVTRVEDASAASTARGQAWGAPADSDSAAGSGSNGSSASDGSRRRHRVGGARHGTRQPELV